MGNKACLAENIIFYTIIYTAESESVAEWHGVHPCARTRRSQNFPLIAKPI